MSPVSPRRLLCLAFLLIGLAPVARAQTVQVQYTTSDENFPNPERGFYKHRQVQAEGAPLSLSDLTSLRDDAAISLVLRLYYLKSFRDRPLSEAQLDLMRQDFDVLREAGVKAVLRFAYTSSQSEPDAPLDVIEQHLDQMAPVLQANSDVVVAVQAGFIGAWGEWYYSSNNLNNTAGRRAVTEKILEVLPEDRMVQIRTPGYKRAIFERQTPLADEEAYGRTDYARTGHHNDCFLASSTDYGTYQNVAADKAFLEKDTRFTPMGGETCAVNPPRSECATALEELARFHWSYLNRDYNGYVLGSWTRDGCLDEVRRRLGYRFALVRGEVDGTVRPGGALTLDLALVNQGWAAPFNPRGAELILRERTGGRRYAAALPADPRSWMPGDTVTVEATLGVPADLPAGDYDLLLFLPDASRRLREQAAFAIRLANEDVWEPETGYNDLLVDVTVDGEATGPDYSGSLWLRPYDTYVGTEDAALPAGRGTLLGAFPNPFTDHAVFELDVQRTQHVAVDVYDALGRRVAQLHDGVLAAGRSYRFAFDASGLPSGLYLCRATAAHFVETQAVLRVE